MVEKITWAQQLELFGEYKKADRLYSQLREKGKGVSLDAFVARIRIRERHPDFIELQDSEWIMSDIQMAPISIGENHYSVIRWLIEMNQCLKARSIFKQYQQNLKKTVRYQDIVSLLDTCK